MKLSKIFLLFIVFLLLMVVAAFPSVSDRFPSMQKKEVVNDLPFQSFTNENTKSITIHKKADSALLTKEVNSWKIASYSASPKEIESFFSALKESTIERVVSKNIQNQSEYELASDSGTFVTINSANNTSTFVVGKVGPETGSFYAKKMDSDNVYLVKGPLRDIISAKALDWRNKVVAIVNQANIFSIDSSTKTPFFVTKKDNGKWEVSIGEKKKELEDTDIASAFSYLASLEGYDFLSSEEIKEFASSKQYTITFFDQSRTRVTTLTLADKEADFWIKGDQNDEVMKVYGYKLDGLLKLQEKLQ